MFLLLDHQGGTTTDLQTPVESCPLTVSQKPVSKTRKKLSPIQETSVEANSLTSLSAGHHSPLQEDQDQDQQDKDQDKDHAHAPSAGELSEAGGVSWFLAVFHPC